MKYIILPFFKLIWASVFFIFLIIVGVIGYIVYNLWTFKFKAPFVKGEDYHLHLFEYVAKDTDFSNLATWYQTPFHWALNIGKREMAHDKFVPLPKEKKERKKLQKSTKNTFKDFIEKEKKLF